VYRPIFELGTSQIRRQKRITLGTTCTVRKYGGNQKSNGGTVLAVLKNTHTHTHTHTTHTHTHIRARAKFASVYPSLTNQQKKADYSFFWDVMQRKLEPGNQHSRTSKAFNTQRWKPVILQTKSYSRNSPYLTKPKGSLPFLHGPANGIYLKLDSSSHPFYT
jgi:hypothetical protein